RVLSVPEIFTYSSNIGTARIALKLGIEHHKWFLRKVGQLDRLRTELPESAEPLWPRKWAELNTVTIAFGHGIAVAPLQAMMAIGALMNGGWLIPPTFIKRNEKDAIDLATRVVSADTSDKMRYLMRLNVEKGTASKADVKGYYVGGKTGTSEKVIGGRYSKTKVLTSFTAVLPADQPRYQLLVMLDDPKPTSETHAFATSGRNPGGRPRAPRGPASSRWRGWSSDSMWRGTPSSIWRARAAASRYRIGQDKRRRAQYKSRAVRIARVDRMKLQDLLTVDAVSD